MSARIEMLLCGNGINFLQGDLALSGVFLVRAGGPDGEVLTVIDSGHVGMRRGILQALVKAGVRGEDVDYVALTHVHWDHVQNPRPLPERAHRARPGGVRLGAGVRSPATS